MPESCHYLTALHAHSHPCLVSLLFIPSLYSTFFNSKNFLFTCNYYEEDVAKHAQIPLRLCPKAKKMSGTSGKIISLNAENFDCTNVASSFTYTSGKIISLK